MTDKKTEEWVVHRRLSNGTVGCSKWSMWEDYIIGESNAGRPILYELLAEGLTIEQAWQFVGLTKEKG